MHVAAFLLAVGVAAAPAPESDPAQLREASAIFDSTWSPFCPGRTLASCTSGKASEWREDVRGWLAEGLTREQVMDRLQQRVPGFTLETVPDSGGIRIGPWILGGLFAIALLVLAWFHSRRTPQTETREANPKQATGEEARLLARELELLED